MNARGLAPLRHRGFRLLAAGQLGSNVGDAFYAVALPWYVLAPTAARSCSAARSRRPPRWSPSGC